MIVLLNFIGTIIAAASGSLMAPAFIQFLNEEKNKKKQQLIYLEELYLLSLELEENGSSLPIRTACFLEKLENNGDLSTLLPEPKDPLPRIEILLDYHLTGSPDDLHNKIKELRKESLEMYRPIGELIGYKYKIKDRGDYNLKAFDLSLSVSTKSQKLSEEIRIYAKQEKSRISMELSKIFYKRKDK